MKGTGAGAEQKRYYYLFSPVFLMYYDPLETNQTCTRICRMSSFFTYLLFTVDITDRAEPFY